MRVMHTFGALAIEQQERLSPGLLPQFTSNWTNGEQ